MWPFLQYFLERETGFERLARVVENPRVRHPAQIKILVQKHEAWSGRRDSNPRYLPWQGSALPLSHSRKFNFGGGGDGTCTRVPTQDYLTFYARSLFTDVAHNRQQTGCFVPRLLGLTKWCKAKHQVAIHTIWHRVLCRMSEQSSMRWVKLRSVCHSVGTACAIVSV